MVKRRSPKLIYPDHAKKIKAVDRCFSRTDREVKFNSYLCNETSHRNLTYQEGYGGATDLKD